MSDWTTAFALNDLAPGQARLLKTDTHRVAVFRLQDGAVFAVDNACPHEGYPLVQGEVRGQVLTCAWHNYKFELGSGACIKGDEDVQAYATRIQDGQIEVELTRPDPAVVIQRARESFEQGMLDAEAGRMARDAVRLLQAGVPAAELLLEGAILDARYAEYGATHALPVAVDLMEYLSGDIERDTNVIVTLMELVSESGQHRPRQVWAEPQQSDAFETDLSQAIEAEDNDRAIGLVRAAVTQAGYQRAGAALVDCASEHFLGFGHGLIYATKAMELLKHDDRNAQDILCALTLRLISSTREDVLPPMARWRKWVGEHHNDLKRGTTRITSAEQDHLAERIVDPQDKTIEADFLQHIAEGIDSAQLVDVLVHAAALRLLSFDPTIHDDWTVQDGWLDVTHPLTFAHAIRDALRVSDTNTVLINLVWSLAFTRRGHRLDQPAFALPAPQEATTKDITRALDRHDPQVVALAQGFDGDWGELAEALRDWILAGQAAMPIFIAHQIKTTRVAMLERRNRVPLLAVLRYLSTPVVERSTRSVVHDAVRLVVHGNLPRRRAS